MGAHDYIVLAVVAFVGVVAMVTMAFYSGQEAAPTGDFIPLTGQASSRMLYTNAIPAPTPPDFDYSGDGVLTVRDAELLAQYILEQRCPMQKTCDINNDGLLTMRDLELFNSMVASWESPKQPSVSTVHYRAIRIPSTVGSRLA